MPPWNRGKAAMDHIAVREKGGVDYDEVAAGLREVNSVATSADATNSRVVSTPDWRACVKPRHPGELVGDRLVAS